MRLRTFAAGVALPLAAWGASPLAADAGGPGASAASIQSKIHKVQGRIGAKKGTEHVLSGQIAAYSGRIDRLQARISSLHAREVRVQADLDAKRAELTRTQAALRAARARLVRLRARLRTARSALSRRLVDLYEADHPDILTVVLNARGFADLIERGDFMKRISDQDRAIIRFVREARAQAILTAARLRRLALLQRALTAGIQRRRDEISAVKRDLVGTRTGYARTRAGERDALSHVHVQRARLEGALSHLRAEQATISRTLRARQGALPAGPVQHGGGTLIWPVSGPITSQFCERRAWEACHPGLDIGVAAGTPIRAAAAGRVALVQSEAASGGYGNFTCIQHTGALSTCYAHQSSITVSVGQHVTQGQVIGLSGCTGRCFGAHLHFEVRINGAVTNPLAYL